MAYNHVSQTTQDFWHCSMASHQSSHRASHRLFALLWTLEDVSNHVFPSHAPQNPWFVIFFLPSSHVDRCFKKPRETQSSNQSWAAIKGSQMPSNFWGWGWESQIVSDLPFHEPTRSGYGWACDIDSICCSRQMSSGPSSFAKGRHRSYRLVATLSGVHEQKVPIPNVHLRPANASLCSFTLDQISGTCRMHASFCIKPLQIQLLRVLLHGICWLGRPQIPERIPTLPFSFTLPPSISRLSLLFAWSWQHLWIHYFCTHLNEKQLVGKWHISSKRVRHNLGWNREIDGLHTIST